LNVRNGWKVAISSPASAQRLAQRIRVNLERHAVHVGFDFKAIEASEQERIVLAPLVEHVVRFQEVQANLPAVFGLVCSREQIAEFIAIRFLVAE
jgi:hypothetical protein